jgi:hypothetical protein
MSDGPSPSSKAPSSPTAARRETNGSPSAAAPRRRASAARAEVPLAERGRRGSLLSELSLQEATMALRNTTEQVFVPTASESSPWHSIPLAFAVLPAIGGVLFTNGNYFVTDVMLLFLVAVFLHWLIKFPWQVLHLDICSYMLLMDAIGNGTIARTHSDTSRMPIPRSLQPLSFSRTRILPMSRPAPPTRSRCAGRLPKSCA